MNFKTVKLKPFGLLITPIEGREDIRELEVDQLRALFKKEHLIALRGFNSFRSAEEFSTYSEKWGEASIWPFGKVLEIVQQDKPEDHIFDNTYVPLHWDGMYRDQIPEIQIFHCVSSPGNNNGGRTTFTNTKMIYENASLATRKSWKKVIGTYERKMEFYDSKTIAPLIYKHPVEGFPVLRFCEPPIKGDESFLNHSDFDFSGVDDEEKEELFKKLQKALYAKENFYAHDWQTGDVVFADNYTLLHGRESFTKSAPRHLRRIQVLGRPALDNPHLEYTK